MFFESVVVHARVDLEDKVPHIAIVHIRLAEVDLHVTGRLREPRSKISGEGGYPWVTTYPWETDRTRQSPNLSRFASLFIY